MSDANGKITLKEGCEYTQTWINKDEIHTGDLHAFTVNLSELISILNDLYPGLVPNPGEINEKKLAARFYLGYRRGRTGVLAPSLVMCGVQNFDPANGNYGYEEYASGDGPAKAYKAGASLNDLYVYDFAYPCPDTCTLDSPLMHHV
jgi:hypothetical protein